MKTIAKLGILAATLAAFTTVGIIIFGKKKEATKSATAKGSNAGNSQPEPDPANMKLYNTMIQQGDNLYNRAAKATVNLQTGLLDQAINRYNAALKYKPNDPIAKKKIEQAEDDKPSALDVARNRLKQVIASYKDRGVFSSTADAEFLIKNLTSLEEVDRPTKEDIRAVLKVSNMVYFDGKVTLRMSKNDAIALIKTYSLKKAMNQVPQDLMGYKGGFDEPNFDPYPSYQLKKLAANGYWFGLISVASNGSTVGYGQPYNNNANHTAWSTIYGVYNGYLTAGSGSDFGYVVTAYDVVNGDQGRSLVAGIDNYRDQEGYYLSMKGKVSFGFQGEII